jgi:hypothetical protein
MIFFTRELYQGVQPNSGWERRATREWHRAADDYQRYYEVISPRLPATVRRLCGDGLHDSVVRSASHRAGELILVLDLANALSGFRGRVVQLTFRGVPGRIRTSHLVGQWWLYEEAHLRPVGRFSLHVLFDKDELEIDAEELLLGRESDDAMRWKTRFLPQTCTCT